MRSRFTRREFGALTIGGMAAAVRLKPDTTYAYADPGYRGVRLGAQSYSFRDLPRTPGGDGVDQVIRAFKECELVECELFAPQVEPQFSSGARGRRGDPPSPEAIKAREDLRKWRLETPLDHFKQIGEKFKKAGIEIYAYNYSPNMSFTDAEIDRGFEMTKALGAQIITASTQLDTAKRIVPFAEKHKMIVAMHGHSNTSDPNEFSTPESFAAAMKLSKYFKVNLDIGHFTAANYDAIAYMKEHHADITNLHLKDRKKNQGDNMPWGQGDTPIKEALQLLQREKWPIRAYIEYEYKGQGTSVEEVKRCLAYAKAALA
jgi:sugar phosphate isomerase/epimerase